MISHNENLPHYIFFYEVYLDGPMSSPFLYGHHIIFSLERILSKKRDLEVQYKKYILK